MDLRAYLMLLRRWWWLLALGLLVPAIPTYFLTKETAPTYSATTTIFVNQSAAPNAVTYNDALLNQQLVKTYAQMAVQPVVIADATAKLGFAVSPGAVSAAPVRDTQLFRIAASGGDPALVAQIANKVAEVFIARQTANLPTSQATNALQVAQPALVPTRPVGPKLAVNVAAAAALGLAVAIGLVRLLEYLDDTIKTSEDLEDAAGLKQLGAVDFFKRGRRKHRQQEMLSPLPSKLPAAEAYRRLRTILGFVLPEHAPIDGVHPCRIILVTSANPREGKSTTVANLAMIMAQANMRVVVVDADLRRPSQHRLFGVSNGSGMSNLLLSLPEDGDDFLVPTAVEGLRVLPSGPLSSNPTALLTSDLLAPLLARLRAGADMILIDSPPVLAISDALDLAKHVDGTLLVVDATRTRAPQVRAANEALLRSGTRILGAVLNKLSRRHHPYRTYYYYDRQPTARSTAAPRQGLFAGRWGKS